MAVRLPRLLGRGPKSLEVERREYRAALWRAGRERPLTLGVRTWLFGAVVVAGVTYAGVAEVTRVWRRGSAPLPRDADDVFVAAEEAARQTVEVALEGVRETPPRELAAFNLLASFVVTSVLVRWSTVAIRSRGSFGPFRDLRVGERHVHHFVPGIVIAFVSGGASVVSRNEGLEEWLAIPFGAGVALTLDESALLLQLEDVYWTEEGVLSVQIALGTAGMFASGLLLRRLLRRGEARVLDGAAAPGPTVESPA